LSIQDLLSENKTSNDKIQLPKYGELKELFDRENLEWLRKNGFICFPGEVPIGLFDEDILSTATTYKGDRLCKVLLSIGRTFNDWETL
jgi:hypothetical protein